MDSFKGKKIHFIGIGGVGVNALAKYVMDEGGEVSGSDAKVGDLCEALREKGASICEGTDVNLIGQADVAVFSSAIKEDNAELAFARQKGIPVFERHVFLHDVAAQYGTVVGIAGTHGKTTTTAMLAHILYTCGKNFAAMIGGISADYGNYVNTGGDKDIFVAEACEYKRNFLTLKPTVAVVTNIECDHPDCYSDFKSVKSAFDEYLSGAKVKIFGNTDGDDGWEIISDDGVNTQSYSAEISNFGCRFYHDGVYIGNIKLIDDGIYNFKNATFAIAAAHALGINVKDSILALNTFKGVDRRFERYKDLDGVPVYFDFAHHPTEIACVLKRAARYGKILAVFQPHTYSRTKAYFNEFVDVLGANNDIGTLMLLPTYAARENFDAEYESDALCRAIIKKYGKQDVFVAKDGKSSAEFAAKFAKNHDVVLFIGAGDIYDIKKLL